MADPTIPQADSLPKLRRLLEGTKARGSMSAAGEAIGLSPRHVGYYAAAAEALQLARRVGGTLCLSQLGQQLLASENHSQHEAEIWRNAIQASPTVQSVAPRLLATLGPTKEDLTARIRRAAGHSTKTAERRAETLLRWRKLILSQLRQGQLPSKVTSGNGMQYKGSAVLRSLSITSFKAFGDPKSGTARASRKIDLGPLTVLAGPNGAGKSTILQALDILGALVRGTISEMLEAHGWDYGDLPHLLSAKQTISLEVEVETGSSVLRWALTLGARKHPGIAEERVSVRARDDAAWTDILKRTGRSVTLTRERSGERVSPPPITLAQSWLATLDVKEDADAYPGLVALRTWAEGIHALWSLNPTTLRSPSRGTKGLVDSHGGELASFLFRLKKRDPKEFAAFVARVAKYYPRLVEIEPRSAQYGWKYLAITERWNGQRATFNAKQVSDGLLRLMAVASIPNWEVRPSLVLLDEIENGLHPRLIGGIAALLDEITATTQVVTTTHSPITLNYVPGEAVRLVTRGKSGTVVVTPLTETRGYASLRTHFEPGELWYNVGEDRLLAPTRTR